ncbi:Uracil-DNA glycosylase [Pseudolycoriella hygida]|uniref:Uracil-DNA glycosylase n=1 Tax=Pseudolycoriella hygida TaxID=35572 RepID=A0A9Q0N3L5_9DIPT|nr:Uracil-DNA glycosylase [Pseudolycoriella hygida]
MAQRSITNFFKTSSTKRSAEEVERESKRQKIDELQSDVKVAIEALRSLHPTLSNIGTTWLDALQPEFKKDYFKNLCSFLEVERKSHTIYPPPHQVYTWTRMCKVIDVKVVILGQDPYHVPRWAHGVSFPPSLRNIFKELRKDIAGIEDPKHGDLTGWAKQGVLLLNAYLAVRANNPNSHAGKGWEELTDAVIKYLDQSCNSIVFLLWGAYAEKKGQCDQKQIAFSFTHHTSIALISPSRFPRLQAFFPNECLLGKDMIIETSAELRPKYINAHISAEADRLPIKFEKFQQWKRTTAFVSRFVNNLKAKLQKPGFIFRDGLLTRQELQEGENALLRKTQIDELPREIEKLLEQPDPCDRRTSSKMSKQTPKGNPAFQSSGKTVRSPPEQQYDSSILLDPTASNCPLCEKFDTEEMLHQSAGCVKAATVRTPMLEINRFTRQRRSNVGTSYN